MKKNKDVENIDAGATAAEQNKAAQTAADTAQAKSEGPEEPVLIADEIVQTPIEKQRDEYLQLAQRIQADFDNFRKRNASARQDARDEATREILADLLPVLDNMELSVYHASQAGQEGPLYEGAVKVLKHFQDLMQNRYHVEEIPALGEMFDPNLHNAVMQSPVEEGQKDGEIIEVFQKGYRAQEKVLRYSMVRVAKA